LVLLNSATLILISEVIECCSQLVLEWLTITSSSINSNLTNSKKVRASHTRYRALDP